MVESHPTEQVISRLNTEFIPKRVIVIPTDGSKPSQQACTWAINNIVQKDSDEVVLLNVRPAALSTVPIELGHYLPPHEVMVKQEESLKQQSHQLLTAAAKEFQDAHIHVKAIALLGDARDCLERKVHELKPTFVVMADRGHSNIHKVLLGSVSQHMVHHSHAPVVIVPTQLE